MQSEKRRKVLKGATGLLLAGCVTPMRANEASTTQATADETHTTADTWMAAWMGPARLPVGALHVGRFADPIYYLIRPITWTPNKGQERYKEVNVPVGFVTDFASIPRAFWSLLRPDGKYTYAAVVHDYLYWFQERTREDCDTIFKLGMEDFSIDSMTVKTVYSAVRAGGKSAWKSNGKLRNGGEKRILTRFPEDPRITWDEWKKMPANFA